MVRIGFSALILEDFRLTKKAFSASLSSDSLIPKKEVLLKKDLTKSIYK